MMFFVRALSEKKYIIATKSRVFHLKFLPEYYFCFCKSKVHISRQHLAFCKVTSEIAMRKGYLHPWVIYQDYQ